MFKKYEKIYRLGHTETKDVFNGLVYIQEKIDGANLRFYVTNTGKLVFGSRTQQLTSSDGEDTNVAKNFKRGLEYVKDKLKDKDLTKYSRYVFFGEACFKHTLNYDWDKIPPFLGFDVYDTVTEKYVDNALHIFEELGLEHVPILGFKQNMQPGLVNEDIVPVSKYINKSSECQKAEGVVFKNYDLQVFSKYVQERYKELNQKTFKNKKEQKVDDTNNTDFVELYCTDIRIEKVVMKQVNSGKDLCMSLMGTVIKEVYLDIITEEWHDILLSNWKLDFKNVRKLVANRCRTVLNQMIINNLKG
jgi:hypothetical protein